MAAHPDIGVVHPCPLALPPRAVMGAAAQAPVALGPHAVLVVGRMARGERYKGHDQLIDAWPAVIAAVPDAQLVIVGGGDDRDRLAAKAAAGQGAASIVFTGFIPQEALDALFAACALFALPSRGEGFGLVYLEAMAHARPCVGSIHDAAGDVIEDGVTGRLVDQADIPGLAAILVDLLNDGTTRRRMGEAGRARVAARFSFEQFRTTVVDLLGTTAPPPVVPVGA